MDGQSESISIMRASQGKNGMVRKAGELMKLTEKNKNTSISTLGGEGGENAKDKEDR